MARKPKPPPRKEVRRIIQSVYLEGDLDACIDQLEGYKVMYAARPKLHLEMTHERWDDNDKLYLCCWELETDAEYERRLAQERQTEEAQRRQYEALKKKFGDT